MGSAAAAEAVKPVGGAGDCFAPAVFYGKA